MRDDRPMKPDTTAPSREGSSDPSAVSGRHPGGIDESTETGYEEPTLTELGTWDQVTMIGPST